MIKMKDSKFDRLDLSKNQRKKKHRTIKLEKRKNAKKIQSELNKSK
jgi:hypothetical protein